MSRGEQLLREFLQAAFKAQQEMLARVRSAPPPPPCAAAHAPWFVEMQRKMEEVYAARANGTLLRQEPDADRPQRSGVDDDPGV